MNKLISFVLAFSLVSSVFAQGNSTPPATPSTNTNSLIGGSIITIPNLGTKPACSSSLDGFFHYGGSNSTSISYCNGTSWIDVNLTNTSTGQNITIGSFLPRSANKDTTVTIPDGDYIARSILFTIPGDANLIATNIKSGVTVFGVTGTHTGVSDLPDGDDVTIDNVTPGASNIDAKKDIPRGYYDGTEDAKVRVLGDNNLTASNIKDGVTIFGVEGTLDAASSLDPGQNINVSVDEPTISNQIQREDIPAGNYDGSEDIILSITGDPDLVPAKIKDGVTIFGVEGTFACDECPSYTDGNNFTATSVVPGSLTKTQNIDIPAGLYDGSEDLVLTVGGDADLVPVKIKKDETIFGVKGTFDPLAEYPLTVEDYTFTAPSPTYEGVHDRTILPKSRLSGETGVFVFSPVDTDLIPANIKKGVSIFNQMGTYAGVAEIPITGSDYSFIADHPRSASRVQILSIPDGTYDGSQSIRATIRGDQNLLPSNIKSGVSLFGVTGTLEALSSLPNGDDLRHTAQFPSTQNVTYRIPIPRGVYSPTAADVDTLFLKIIGDSDLISSNIKDGITILGVEGDYDPVEDFAEGDHIEIDALSPRSSVQTQVVPIPRGIYSHPDKDSVRVTIDGDFDFRPHNIKRGVSIFNVTGTLDAADDLVVGSDIIVNVNTPTASAQTQTSIIPVGNYLGTETLSLKIKGDPDLVPSKIKDGENLFGVTGDYDPVGDLTKGSDITVTANTPSITNQVQKVAIPQGYYSHESASLDSVEITINGDADLVPEKIKKDEVIFGVTGTYDPSPTITGNTTFTGRDLQNGYFDPLRSSECSRKVKCVLAGFNHVVSFIEADPTDTRSYDVQSCVTSSNPIRAHNGEQLLTGSTDKVLTSLTCGNLAPPSTTTSSE